MAKKKGYYTVEFEGVPNELSVLYYDGELFWNYGDDMNVETDMLNRISAEPLLINQTGVLQMAGDWYSDS